MKHSARQTSIASLWYAGLVLAGAVGLLVHLWARYADAQPAAPAEALALWLALAVVAAVSPIPLPRAHVSVNLAPAVEFAGVLLFGPLNATWVAVLGNTMSGALTRWTPPSATAARLGQSMLAVGLSSIVYLALGGRLDGGILGSTDQAAPLFAAGLVYLVVKSVLDGVRRFVGARQAGAPPWWAQVSVVAGLEAAVLPFGVALALTQVRIGPVGVALFLIPLLLARYSFRLWHASKTGHMDTVRTLMRAIDAADPFTWGLSYRVSKMSLRVGRELGLSERDLEELEYAALLHDIGRTAIKRDILAKPGRLTENEQAALRTHPRVGSEIVAPIPFFPGAAEIVHAHHEQPDGKGYPRGQRADDIPMGSRIIMVVAAFDAMTSDRPYRRGLPPETAFEELLQHVGTQFFPEVVEALIQLYSQGRLFEEFAPEMITAYGEGGPGNSRALEEHLRRQAAGEVPEKLGSAESGESSAEEVAAQDAEPVFVEKVIPLDAAGGYEIEVAAISDVGCVRGNNEDSFGVFEAEAPRKGCLLVVADGMGGAAAGEVASRLAVNLVSEHYLADRGRHRAHESLRSAIQRANRAVFERSSGDEKVSGMGTTCTAAGITGHSLVVGHVGDSRAYVVREGSIEQITADHTLAAELAQAGASAAAPANARHLLTRCLGNQEEVEVDLSARVVRLDDGDAIVLCSDGLAAVVEDDEIRQFIQDGPPGSACRGLTELARSRGGPDNITVVVGRLKAAA